MTLSQQFAKDCRDEVKYYLSRAKQAKAQGLPFCRRTCLEMALENRKNARKWASEQ